MRFFFSMEYHFSFREMSGFENNVFFVYLNAKESWQGFYIVPCDKRNFINGMPSAFLAAVGRGHLLSHIDR